MTNLNFDFEGFAHLDEKLEQAALDILANEPAELIHITDAELDKMADDIIFQEDIVQPAIAKVSKKYNRIIAAYLSVVFVVGGAIVGSSVYRNLNTPQPTVETCRRGGACPY